MDGQDYLVIYGQRLLGIDSEQKIGRNIGKGNGSGYLLQGHIWVIKASSPEEAEEKARKFIQETNREDSFRETYLICFAGDISWEL